MSKRVIHRFDLDFASLKKGQLFESVCGKRYIAEDPPTPEESELISQRTKDHPICKKCDKLWPKIPEPEVWVDR